MSVSLARVDRTEKLSLRDMEVHDGCSRAQSLPLRSCCHVDSAQAMKQLPSSHCQLISPAHPCAAENGMCLSTLPLEAIRGLLPDPSPWL